jgi:hypothetical protein
LDKPATEDLLLDSLNQAIEEFRQIREQIQGGMAPGPLKEASAPPVIEREGAA